LPAGSPAADPAPRTAWEHYTVGRGLLQAGDLPGGAAAFDPAGGLPPQGFWPWFGAGRCAYLRQGCHEAGTPLPVCVARPPDPAECYHSGALALAARGERARARADYDRALDLDPTLAAAALNRGALHVQERRWDAADADLRLALSLGADPAAVHYNRALALA